MKKLLILMAFVAITISGFSQSAWDGFLRPVTHQQFENRLAANPLKAVATGSSVWLFRPAIEISATQLVYDRTTKDWASSSFTSAGVGLGYQHYVDNNGTPYNNYGFNLLILFTAIPTETSPASVSFAGTFSALKFIDIGGGYNATTKNPFVLLGISYNF
jgi:hypothetical protein